MGLEIPIKYEGNSFSDEALKNTIDKYVNCASIASIPLVKSKDPHLKVVGAILNSVLINTLIFGGISFIVANKDNVGKALGMTFGMALLCSALLCTTISIAMYQIRHNCIEDKEGKKESLRNVARDVSWTNPVGLITNASVMAYNEISGKEKRGWGSLLSD